MSSKIHILQHVSFEGAGSIETWGRQNDFSISKTRFLDANWSLPTVKDFDLLVIMGGPMGVNDEASFPWLKEEKSLIEKAMAADKKIIGVCLGAQLIASVLGARVYSNKHKEFGWFEVEKTEEAKQISIVGHFPNRFLAFHWHSDTFDLPIGSSRLFFSKGCEQQGFLFNTNILALQFHTELAREDILALLTHCGQELQSSGTFVQPESEIKANIARTKLIRPLLFELLDQFMQLKKSEILEPTKH